MLKIEKDKIIFFILIFSATFVCLKMTPGGEPIALIIFFKALCRTCLLSYVLINIYKLLSRKIVRKYEPAQLYSILLLMILSSIIYSVDRYNSIFASIEFITSTCAAFFIGLRFKTKQDVLFEATALMSFLVSIVLVYFYITSPDDIFVSMNGSYDVSSYFGLGGNIIHVHNLAMLYLVLLVCLFWTKTKSVFNLPFIIVTTLALISTLSRTGFIILLTIVPLWIFLKRRSQAANILIYSFTICSFGALLVFYYDNILQVFMRGASAQDILSGSNRTYIFSSGILNFLQSPLVGFGFDNLSYEGDYLSVNGSYTRSSLHNQFLYILVCNGIIGLIIFVLFLISTFLKVVIFERIHRMRNISFFIVLLIFSLTQDTLMNDSTPLQFLFFVMLGSSLDDRRSNAV